LALAATGAAQFALEANRPVSLFPTELENQEVAIEGFVSRASLPILEGGIDNDSADAAPETYQQLDLEVDRISSEDEPGPQLTHSFGARVSVYSVDADAESIERLGMSFHYGQRLRIRGRIRSPQIFGDPGVFDRRAYLRQQGIVATLNAKRNDIQVLPGTGGTLLGRWRAQTRESLLIHILRLQSDAALRWPLFAIRRTDAGLLAAMILGERSLLDQRVKRDFQRTGSYHLLVVSGMAVAILAFAVFWICRLCRMPEVAATILSVIFVALYVTITDLGAPVQRAALMCGVYMLARLFYRGRDVLNAIGLAALAGLAIDPASLFDAGFQMTFLAVIAIAGIAIPVLERTTAVYRKALYQPDSTSYDLHLLPSQAQFRLNLRMLLVRVERLVPKWIARMILFGDMRVLLRVADIFLISALMQAALALPMAVYFHRATTLALPANVAVVPVMSFLFPIAVIATLCGYAGAWLAFIPKVITALLLHLVSFAVITVSHFRAADLRVPTPSSWASCLCLLAVALCLLTARRRHLLFAGSLLALAFSDVCVLYARKPETIAGKLEVTAIDVGQGDSLLVVTPQGKTLLMDGGGTLGVNMSGFDIGEEVVSPYLWSRGFSHLDAVALSHAHGDHIGGLPAVLANFHPDALWIAPGSQTQALEGLMTEASRFGIPVVQHTAGDRFNFGGAAFTVLAPLADETASTSRGNDDSMVVEIACDKASVLLEGDAEKRTERIITPELGRITLLKVAHHGSATSSTPELVARTQPEFAVISVGRFNRYGHPRAEVLERLRSEGACTYRTDTTGATSFFLNGEGVDQMRWGREQTTMEFPSRFPRPRAGHCAALR
jgi:competence protein ComEC